MKINFLTVEEDYDPGFTLVVNLCDKTKSGEYYIREKGIISKPTPIDNYHWHSIRGFAWNDSKGLQNFMDDIARGIQYQKGWRISLT